MRIAFLNGCLEPGRDGVGDYTRLLAQECEQQGHDCCTIALNDRYGAGRSQNELERGDGGLQQMRLPSELPWQQRISEAEKAIAEFKPDWVSLQFVPYAFHPKGLPFGLAQRLMLLTNRRSLHVMFHELWIGDQVGATYSHRVTGWMQKQIILSLLTHLKPKVVHTSNSTSVARLKACGVAADRLPLFGNIPVTQASGNAWLLEELNKTGLALTLRDRDQFWYGGFFGGIPPFWPPEPFFAELLRAADSAAKRVVIWSAGRIGAGKPLWDAMVKRYSPGITFIEIGEQPASCVSEYLNALDFGIATAPCSLIGKSGAVAAMLDHGLPVIVNRDDEHFQVDAASDLAGEPLLHQSYHGLAKCIKGVIMKQPAKSRLQIIASTFLDAISVKKN